MAYSQNEWLEAHSKLRAFSQALMLFCLLLMIGDIPYVFTQNF